MEDQIIELTRQVTILNERLPNHIAWTERNVKDHESRLRDLEATVPKDLREQLVAINKFRWVIYGVAMASGGLGALVTKILGG